MKLAAQMYTVREYLKDEKQIFESLKKIKDIGYRAIQISAFGEYKTENLSAMVKELGLEICATHTPIKRLTEDTKAVIAEHRLLGIKYVGLGGFFGKTLDEYKQLLTELNPACNMFADNGLKFIYHNHHHEFRKLGGVTPMQYFLENTDKNVFGLLPDFYWLQYAGVDFADFLQKNKERIKVVHFKDMRITAEDNLQEYAEIFEGNMNYKAIYNACVECGVEWAAVEQDVCTCNPFESLKLSYDNIKKRNLFD